MLTSSKRGYRLAGLLTTIVIVLFVALFLTEGSRLQDVVVAATTVVGAVAIWFQMKRSKDMAEGEFILMLNDSFSANEDIKSVYSKLISEAPLVEEDRTAIVEYLTFFETIHLLMQRDVADLKLLDDLFRYRFLIAVNNPQVQDMELLPDARYYRNIYTLYSQWRKLLKKLPDAEIMGTPLHEANPDFSKYVKDALHF